jgi:integrase/recombinase XerD
VKKNPLLKYVQNFFQLYLPNERGLSTNTVKSYRDTLKLFFEYAAKSKKRRIQQLSLDDLTVEAVLKFLDSLEKKRENSIRTRNQRLAVLKTFFSYLVTQDLTRSNQYEKIGHVTMKRQPYVPITYLTEEEVQAVMDSINKSTPQGVRDYAIFLLLYNTGARVQELCDLTLSSIRFEKPHIITLVGKGNKTRHVPLWEITINALQDYLTKRQIGLNEKIFQGKRGEGLSRFGIRYLIQTHVKQASKKCSSLKAKKIGPHTLRHTTAMHLLQSGVDIAVIKTWLGHVDLNTTHNYVEIDMKMKQKALEQRKQPTHSKTIRAMLDQEKSVLKWLETL